MEKNKPQYSYVTVLCNDAYYPGVVALWYSLLNVKSKYGLCVLCSENVSESIKNTLREVAAICTADEITIANTILKDNTSVYRKWNQTFFKLNVANMTQFSKIVLLDADMIVLRNIDHLFDRPHMSCTEAGKLVHGNEMSGINSGTMVIEPSYDLFKTLISSIQSTKDRLADIPVGDQDVYRTVYPDWIDKEELHLPETYNCFVTDIDALKHMRLLKSDDLFVAHYAMVKPWLVSKLYPVQVIYARIKLHDATACRYTILFYYKWWMTYLQGKRLIKKYQE